MRARAVWTVALAACVAVSGVLIGLAATPATSQGHWPGPLDLLRRHPWAAVLVLGALVVLGTAVGAVVQERQSGGAPVPAPFRPVPEWAVSRAESRQVVQAVCGQRRHAGLVAALSGAGGFGKSTLARMVCADPRVRRRFRERVYFVMVGREARGPAAVAAKVAEVTRFITGDTQVFEDPDLAGAHLGRLLDQDGRRVLLVLDDVWEAGQLGPFLHGGSSCVRLITTRVPTLLPPGTRTVSVDRMTREQARAVLTCELPQLPGGVTERLLRAAGGWALLLRLVNRVIAEQVRTGASAAGSAEAVLARLRSHGPAVVDPATWDMNDPERRSRAVRATVEAATGLLQPDEARRFAELGVFAADEAVPVPVVAGLWERTGGMPEIRSRQLCASLADLSLLSLSADGSGHLVLHGVIRDYLLAGLGDAALAEVHGHLVDGLGAGLPSAGAPVTSAAGPGTAWWQSEDTYLLDRLIEHLVAAGRVAEAEAVAGDLRWVERRLDHRGPTAPWGDLTRVPTRRAAACARDLAQAAHLLSPIEPPDALTDVLHSRLGHLPHWQAQVAARREEGPRRPALVNLWPPPDLPAPALLRTLTGQEGSLTGLAVAPDGTWLATSSTSGVRIWDRETWQHTLLAADGDGVSAVTVAADGTWFAAYGQDGTVRIWEREEGGEGWECTTALPALREGAPRAPVSWAGMLAMGHARVAVAPDGRLLATSGAGGLRIWERRPDGRTWACTASYPAGSVAGLAISPDGTWLAAGGRDEVLVWDRETGNFTARLPAADDGISAVAIAPDGTWFVTASACNVRVWEQRTDAGGWSCAATHPAEWVSDAAVARDGTWFATVGPEAVLLWERRGDGGAWTCTAALHSAHLGMNARVAVAPDGTWLATTGTGAAQIVDRASMGGRTAGTSAEDVTSVAMPPDGTWLAANGAGLLRIWERATRTCVATLTDPAGKVAAVAVAPDGTWLAAVHSGRPVVSLWERDTGSGTWHRAAALPFGHGAPVSLFDDLTYALAVAPDGTWFAAASRDRSVGVWERSADSGSWELTATLAGHGSPVTAVAIAPDGTWLATGSDGVRIWERDTDGSTWKLTATLPRHASVVTAVAVAADGTWLAAGGDQVRRWERDTDGGSWHCTATFGGHTGQVCGVAFSPDGTRLATTDHGGTLRLWDPAARRVVGAMRTDRPLWSCAWSRDGRTLAVAGASGLCLYEVRL